MVTIIDNTESIIALLLFQLHAFGSAAQVSAAGLGTAIGRLKATQAANPDLTMASSASSSANKERSSPVPSHRPMFILFSRSEFMESATSFDICGVINKPLTN